MKKFRLPNTPSKLIRLALHDLREVEKDKEHYVINMGTWHEPIGEHWPGPLTKCAVCLAGAVIARRSGYDRRERVSLWSRGLTEHYDKFDSLDDFRRGDIDRALAILDIDLPPKIPGKIRITPYHKSPGKFKRDMRKLATRLEKVGL